MIGERTAENAKIAAGSAYPLEEEVRVPLRGRDLLTGLPKSSDVVALSFCHILTLSKDDFMKFLTEYPNIRAEIEKTAAIRAEDNRMSLIR